MIFLMKIKNYFILLALAALAGTNLFAQNSRVSLGVELALPGGDYGNQSGTGFGASLRYEMPVGTNLGLMATVGYITYGKKTYGITEYTNSLIPIMAGAKYYFTEQQN